MPAVNAANRRFVFLGVTAAIVILLWYITSAGGSPSSYTQSFGSSTSRSSGSDLHVDESVALDGKAIAPKLGNETLKAELGRAAWKVFHTTLARFPEKPTADESECAQHFGTLLQKYPPQVSGRNVAAGWGCHIHNKVNEEIGKPVFDCSKIGDFYDCGCAEDEKRAMNERAVEPLSTQPDSIAPPVGGSTGGSGPLTLPPGMSRKDIKTDRTYVNMGFMKYEMTREQMRALQQTGRSLSGDIYKPTEESDGSNLGINMQLQDAARGSIADTPGKPKKEPVEWDESKDVWHVDNYLPDSI